MTLTEAYLKDIIRPPPTGSVPANVAHPFQTSFYTYFTKKFLPRRAALVAGDPVAPMELNMLLIARDLLCADAICAAIVAGIGTSQQAPPSP